MRVPVICSHVALANMEALLPPTSMGPEGVVVPTRPAMLTMVPVGTSMLGAREKVRTLAPLRTSEHSETSLVVKVGA